MAITFNLAIGQEDTGGEVLVDDSLNAVINLRSLANSYATADYYGALVDHGVYTFTSVPEGIYKVYNGTTELTIFGQIQIGQYNAVLLTGNQTIAGVKTFSSQPVFSAGISTDSLSEKTASAGITFNHKAIINQLFLTSMGKAFSMGGFDISGLPTTPAGSSSATSQTYVESNYFKLTGTVNNITDTTSNFQLRGKGYYMQTPVSPFEFANTKFVRDYVNNYLNNQNSTEQQTETKIIVDYTCTELTNKRYRTITGGMSSAASYADAASRIQVVIDGNGNTDGDMETNYNQLLVTSLAGYIDIIGIEQSCIVTVEESTYTCAALGRNIFRNITFDNVNDAAGTTFANAIFFDCKFINSTGTGSPTYTLTNCITYNCSSSGVAVSLSGCMGNAILDLTNNQLRLTSKIVDAGAAYNVLLANGDIQGKRQLGRKGADITAAASITLGQGNLFVVNGGTTVTTIVTTDWTEGSIVSMIFPDTPTINVGGDNIVHPDGSFTANGGYLYRFQLLSGSWYITNKY
jgi:hypothetical protein